MGGPEIPGETGLNWEGEAHPGPCSCCTRSLKAGPACLPRQGPAQRDLELRHQRRQAAPRRVRQAGTRRAASLAGDELVPESRGAQPCSPTQGQGHLPRGGLPRDPLLGRVPPQRAELLWGVPALRVASPRSTCGSSSRRFRVWPGDPPACPGGAPCAWTWAPPALTPDTHTHRVDSQLVRPQHLRVWGPAACTPHLWTGRERAGVPGRASRLSDRPEPGRHLPSRHSAWRPAGRPEAPRGYGRLGRRGHQQGRQVVSVPPSQEADPALPPPGAPADSGRGLHTGARLHWEQPPGMAEPGPRQARRPEPQKPQACPPTERGHCRWAYVQTPEVPLSPRGAL